MKQVRVPEGPQDLPLGSLEVDGLNVRAGAPETDIEELADTIEHEGIQQRLVVRQPAEPGGKYRIVAGRRRFLAAGVVAKRKGLSPDKYMVPCEVRQLRDAEAVTLSFVENDQRVDMDPMTRAEAIERMLSMTIDGKRVFKEANQVAAAIGRSKQTVSQMRALLRLSPEVREMIRRGEVKESAAIITAYRFTDAEDQVKLADVLKELPAGQQRKVADHVSKERTLLQLPKREFRQSVEAILSPFSPQQQTTLKQLYRRAGRDPDGISWGKMTPERYAKEVESLSQYLARRKENAPLAASRSSPSPKRAGGSTRVELRAEPEPVDTEFDRVFEGLKGFDLDVEFEGLLLRVPVGEIGLTESEVLAMKAKVASYLIENDMVAPKPTKNA